MIPIQDHTPNGVASMYFGGVIYRCAVILQEGMNNEALQNEILNGYRRDWYYTNPINLKIMAAQAKQFGMYFIVNNCTHWFDPDISPDLFGRASGAIADHLIQLGYNKDAAAIALFNEPGKPQYCGHGVEGAKKYVLYCQASHKYVQGGFPLILVNDEYHNIDEKYIFDNTKNIPDRIFGVHHLSSLGNPPNWQNIVYAKTQANEWKVPIICTEGGPWFNDYQSPEGHAINAELLKRSDELDYDGRAIDFVDNNKTGKTSKYPKLGYRVWKDDYSEIISSKNWDKFENELKKYNKEEQPMPEERLIKKTRPPMAGPDVKTLEDKLREIGFDTAEDSTYTDNDYRGVKVFQEIAGIVIDGVVGPQTLGKLNEYNAGNFMPEVFQNIYSSRQYSIELLDYFLENYAIASLKNHGQYFNQAEVETGIPAEWLLGKAWQESGERNASGKFLLGNSYYGRVWKNLFGYGITDSGPMPEYKFETYREGILIVAREIKNLFLDPDNWRYHGDNIFGIEVKYSTACYNAIRKAQYYRQILQILDAGILHPMPKFIEQLLPVLDKYYKRID